MKFADATTISATPRLLQLDRHLASMVEDGKLHPRWSAKLPPITRLGAQGDAVMTALALGGEAERFKRAVPAIAFGRRSIEVAIHRAMTAAEQREFKAIAAEWESLSAFAGDAAKATKKLLTELRYDKLVGSPSITPILGFLENRDPIGRIDYDETRASAQIKADALVMALAVLSDIAHQSEQMGARVRSKSDNPGEPEKNAFVQSMAEAWVFLTGRLPGTGSARNPFMDFALGAWQDAGGDPDAPMRNAVKLARQNTVLSDSPPDWI
ncbi:MAG: hypothetical protein J0I48_16115 [Devosia sp.]|uniref:hypothetical protein n=1 Tax=Devosia sp. 66-22 TaxID=1895753 RepID=UPI000B2EC47D|nr:hypothetical protein [Devosia sp. 66-22]MBN9347696.1 hypothetical protein [Devosia sp.]